MLSFSSKFTHKINIMHVYTISSRLFIYIFYFVKYIKIYKKKIYCVYVSCFVKVNFLYYLLEIIFVLLSFMTCIEYRRTKKDCTAKTNMYMERFINTN